MTRHMISLFFMALLLCSCHESKDEFTMQCIKCFRETGASFNKDVEACLVILVVDALDASRQAWRL